MVVSVRDTHCNNAFYSTLSFLFDSCIWLYTIVTMLVVWL